MPGETLQEAASETALLCPTCGTDTLTAHLTRQGVAVESCQTCRGIWLDRGEFFQFAKNPAEAASGLEDALKIRKFSSKPSPRTGRPMEEIFFPGGGRMLRCPDSGGLWVDADDQSTLSGPEGPLRIDYVAEGEEPDAYGSGAAAVLLALPNLFLRSALTLIGLYGLLLVLLVVASDFLGATLNVTVGIAIVVLLLQFVLGPYVMDLTLKFFYRVTWTPRSALPGHLQAFIDKTCHAQKMTFPHIGIIDDGSPQAFTYGHRPNNARIVISRGLLEILDEDEVEAVVAHEIGHAVHWDMAVMTAAQLVPLITYYIFRQLWEASKSNSSSRGKKGNYGALIAMAFYVIYIVSIYVVLWFSRVREYHADRFAGTVTGKPNVLASALVKIAYGLAGEEPSVDGSGRTGGQRDRRFSAIGAMGIFDRPQAKALAIAGQSSEHRAVNKAAILSAMRWDLWNPWAKWYELNSTHPLVANRLISLSSQSAHMGLPPYISFRATPPESYWDEFLADFGIYILPYLSLLLPLAAWFAAGGNRISDEMIAIGLVAFGFALLIRYTFAYGGRFFPEMTVAALLKFVKVSDVRPVHCTMRGTVIGRGVPGLIYSEDFVMRDDTGIIFLDLRQPLGIWEIFFGLLKAGEFQDKPVVVRGWYRRAPMPYVEIASIECEGKTTRSWVPMLKRCTAIALIVLGFAITLLPVNIMN
ncbi:MAG: M48 family metalloprotease [Pseudomonadota bacterium]